MRTIAILAAIVVGGFLGASVGAIVEMAAGIEAGTIGAIGIVVGAVGLPILVARVVPRSARAQQRHDQAVERMRRRHG